jgi:hypothetical protein
MKQTAFILFIAVFALSCNSERYMPKSDLEASNLKGRIQKIERTVHKAGDKSKCPCNGLDENKQIFYTYNDKGNLTESAKLDEDGNVVLVSKYLYNRQDVCTEIDNYLQGDKPAGQEINTLRGKKVTEVSVLDEEGNTENVYKYGYSGSDLTEGKTLNKSGDLLSSFQNAYVNGQLETRTEKNILLNITTVTQYKRNEANDISEYTVTNSNENTGYVFKLEYEYDDKGNWTKQTQYYNGEIAGIVLRNITYYN